MLEPGGCSLGRISPFPLPPTLTLPMNGMASVHFWKAPVYRLKLCPASPLPATPVLTNSHFLATSRTWIHCAHQECGPKVQKKTLKPWKQAQQDSDKESEVLGIRSGVQMGRCRLQVSTSHVHCGLHTL